MANQLIDNMKKGESEAILTGLFHVGAIYRINAICFSFLTGNQDQRVAKQILHLKEDAATLDGYSVSDYARAALSLMGIEQYQGGKRQVIDLINSKFSFLEG